MSAGAGWGNRVEEVSVRRIEVLGDPELGRLAEILVGVVEAGASVGFLPPLAMDDALAYWQGVVAPDHVLLIAERDGAIVGTAQLELAMRANGRHRAEVCKVLVPPECQRQGIGKALMRAVEDEARRLGRTLLHLDTRFADPANRLYRHSGYTVAGTIPSWARNADGSLAGTTIYYKLLDAADS